MNKLPEEDGEHGYTHEFLSNLCVQLDIKESDFWKAFGFGNTCAVDSHGKTNFYRCDVESALWRLGHKLGRDNGWD